MSILYGFDLNYSNVFFFWMNSDTPSGIASAYFNITEPDPTPTRDSATSSAPSPFVKHTSIYFELYFI
ncbi:uncharacterized protein BDV17DRAFT_295629 [Aspergillus undulatus]|uniref:uncharacterized protein n=1 Tax=Aspergillus undulatus TaxID=1810928 RepID=UPI003CCD4EEE